MATSSPASFFDHLFDRVGQALQPPAWVVDEMQRRLVLALNHVLAQETEAQARLKRYAGRMLEARWRVFTVRLQATPAGLLDLGSPTSVPDLTLTVTEESPWSLAQTALRGDRPAVQIAGDVQLAAEVQWLVDHVRWDLEEDLAKIFGDAPAHAMAVMGRRMVEAMRKFVSAAASVASTGAAAASPAPSAATAPATPASPHPGQGAAGG